MPIDVHIVEDRPQTPEQMFDSFRCGAVMFTLVPEVLAIGGISSYIGWQIHPVVGIGSFFASIFLFSFMMKYAIFNILFSISMTAMWAFSGHFIADKAFKNDLIWDITLTMLFGVFSAIGHFYVATSINKSKNDRIT